MDKPFLFHFLQPCSTRDSEIENKKYYYDSSTGLLMIRKDEGSDIPVIMSSDDRRPMTKKADVEKGEDQKDEPPPRPIQPPPDRDRDREQR